MKQLLLVLPFVIAMFCSIAQAQDLSPGETKRLGDEAEELNLQAMEVMLGFLTKPDTANFNNGRSLWQKSLRNYELVMTKGTLKGGTKMLNSLDAMIYSGSKSLVSANLSVYSQSLLERTMKETEKDRDKKVKFNGQSYSISKSNKERFERLEDGLSKLKN